MGAKQVSGKLLLELLAADGVQRTVNAITGIVEQTIKPVTGQGQDFSGGVCNALFVIQIQRDGFKTQLAQVFNITVFPKGRQTAITPITKILCRNQANTAGAAGDKYSFLNNFTCQKPLFFRTVVYLGFRRV